MPEPIPQIVWHWWTKKETIVIKVDEAQGNWLISQLTTGPGGQITNITNPKLITLQEIKDSYEAEGLEDFELFWDNKPVNGLWKAGLLML